MLRPRSTCFPRRPPCLCYKFPHSWEANAFRDGNYPDPSSFISGHLDPHCPKLQPLYAQVASSSALKKGKKNKNTTTASKVAAISNIGSAPQAPKSRPTTVRRFHARHSSLTEYTESLLIAATFPDIATRVLRNANCTLLLAITAKVNDRGSVTLLISDTTIPAATFTRYFDALTTHLNHSFTVGDSPWLPFCLTPNKVQLAIHSLPLAFLSEDPEELIPSLAVSIRNLKNIHILSARYLT